MSSVGLRVHKTQCSKTYMQAKDIHTLTYAYINVNICVNYIYIYVSEMYINIYIYIHISCVCIILKSETGGWTDDSAFRGI